MRERPKRSPGYRTTNKNRAEVEALRAQLNATKSYEWQKANMLIADIARLLGHNTAPMGGQITARACRYCHYYGHTRQHCKKLAEDTMRKMESELAADKRYLAQLGPAATKEQLALVKWEWDRYGAVSDVCSGCAEEQACMECEACLEWGRVQAEWEAANPAPRQAAQSAA